MASLPSASAADIETLLAEQWIGNATKPTVTDLVDLLDVVFFASLEHDEGRPVGVAVLWAPQSDMARVRHVHAFDQEHTFDSRTLRKLAWALDPSRSAIAVHRPGPNESAKIWGASIRARTTQHPPSAAKVPAQVWVQSRGPGVVVVAYGGRVLWVYDRGDVTYPPEHARAISWVARAFPTALTNWRPPVLYWLAARISRAGHGGILAVVPTMNGTVDAAWTFHEPRHRLKTAYEEYSEACGGDGIMSVEPSVEVVHGLTDEMDAVARLSQIDGAVVLARDTLGVIGFGARLSGEPPKSVVRVVGNGKTCEVAPSRLGGTRHQSSAAWVAANPEAFAIVVSQDGPVALFLVIAGQVVVLPLPVADEDWGATLGTTRIDYPRPSRVADLFDDLVPG